MAKSIARNLADVASPTGVLDGTLSTAAQTNVTSVGTLSSLTVSGNLNATLTTAAQGNITSLGTLTALTVDNLGINGNTITANSGALNLTPASGSAIVLDGTINVDAGVVTGATSITSTAFVGGLTGNVTGNVSGTAATVTGAAQTNITSVGTLTALTVDDITIDGSTISDGGDFTLDVVGSISLDADDTGHIRFKDGGTQYASIYKSGSDATLDSTGDITLDAADRIILSADDNGEIRLQDGASVYGQFKDDSDRFTIEGVLADKDMLFVINDGGTPTTALQLDAASGGNATFAGGVTIDPADGVADEAYALSVRNQEATDGRNYGLWVRAGSNSSDESFSVRNHDNSATYLKVRGDGNVGIGAGTPGYKLEVNGTAHVVSTLSAGAVSIPSQGLTLNQAFGTGVPTITMLGTAANGRAGAIHFTEQGDVSTAAIYSTDGGTGNSGYGGLTIATYQSDLRFATNGLANTRMTINTDGEVGIGTDNPTRKLHVISTGSATYSGSGAGSNIALHLGNLESGAAGRTIGIGMSSESNAEVYLNCVTASSNNGGDFVIASRNGSTRSEKMRVHADGRLEMPVVNLITPSYNHFRGAANGVNSIGGGAVSHGRMRQYTFQQAMNANSTVALLQNQSAHTDVHIQYWIECFHSSRTYRIGHAVWGGYGLYTQSAGHGLDLTITAISSGIKRLDFAAAGVATTAYICMWIYGDSGITVHNGTLADQI